MGIQVTTEAMFRGNVGTYRRFGNVTLAQIAESDMTTMGMTRGRYTLRPPGRSPEPRLRISITVSMPIWTGYRRANDAEKAEWDRFYAALLEHEVGHYQRFADAAQGMYDAIVEAPPEDMARVAESEWTAIMSNQQSYDSSTNHGVRQQTSHGTTVINVPAEEG